MISYGHILVPKFEVQVAKIGNLGCFGHKPYLKTPNFYQIGCLVETIKGKKRVGDLRCGAAMVTKIGKNTLKKYFRH